MKIFTYYKPGERGQSLMEFALLAPVLFMVMLAIFDFGRLMFMYSQVANGAREGARYGSVTGLNDQNPQFFQCEEIRDRVMAASQYPVDIDPELIAIEYDNGQTLYSFTCDDSPPINAVDLGDRIRVTVETEFNFLTPVLTSFSPIDVSMTAARSILRGGTLVPDGYE